MNKCRCGNEAHVSVILTDGDVPNAMFALCPECEALVVRTIKGVKPPCDHEWERCSCALLNCDDWVCKKCEAWR